MAKLSNRGSRHLVHEWIRVMCKDRIGNVGLDWTIGGIGDFTGSGFSDILWENTVDGRSVIWVTHGESHVEYAFPSQGNHWSITGIVDLDHNGRASILWRNIVSGDLIAWRSSVSRAHESATQVWTGAWLAPPTFSVMDIRSWSGEV